LTVALLRADEALFYLSEVRIKHTLGDATHSNKGTDDMKARSC
jgi:hypothetical protein